MVLGILVGMPLGIPLGIRVGMLIRILYNGSCLFANASRDTYNNSVRMLLGIRNASRDPSWNLLKHAYKERP